MKKCKKSGFSLVELMLGTAIIIFALAAASVILRFMTTGFAANTLSRKAQFKQNATADIIRRHAAGEGFFNMGTGPLPDCDYTNTVNGGQEPNIRVCATISEINTLNRSRTVVLVTSYELNGHIHMSTRTFTVANTRGEASAATVHVKVVDFGDPASGTPPTGIPGIKVVAPGLDGVMLATQTTNSAGEAFLEGVDLSNNGVSVQVNGFEERCYFDTPNDPSDSVEWSRRFQTGETKAGLQENSLFNSPIQMHRPGSLEGAIKEVVAGNPPAPDVIVQIQCKSNVFNDLNFVFSTATTDANGNYKIEKVVPGQYFFFVHGSSGTYAGVAVPGDKWDLGTIQTNPAQVVTINEATATTQDAKVIARGTLKGSVKGVKFAGNHFRIDADVKKTPLTLNRLLNRNFLLDNSGGRSPNDFSVSEGAFFLVSKFKFSNNVSTPTNNSGDYIFSNAAPALVAPDANDFENQLSTGALWPSATYFATLKDSGVVPILVHCPNDDFSGNNCDVTNVTMMALGSNATQPVPQTFGPPLFQLRGPGSVDVFNFDIKTNIENTHDVYLLNKDAMGSVKGRILPPAGFACNAASGFSVVFNGATENFDLRDGQVRIFTSPAYANSTLVLSDDFQLVAGGLRYRRFNTAQSYAKLNLGGVDACAPPYEFIQKIPPTLGRPIVINFILTQSNPVTHEFKGSVTGVAKGVGGVINLNAGEMSQKQFLVRNITLNQNWQISIDNNLTFTKQKQIVETTRLEAVSAPLNFEPGEQKGTGGNPPVDITLPPPGAAGPQLADYRWNVAASDTVDFVAYGANPVRTFRFVPINNCFRANGNPAPTFALIKIVKTKVIYGTVKAYDAAGMLQPVLGATVTIRDTSPLIGSPEDTFVTEANVVPPGIPNPGLQYWFNRKKFDPLANNNLEVSVAMDGYQANPEIRNPFEDYTEQIDFVLTKIVSSQSGQ